MYIEPRTNIRILKNVPLDTTYEHTLWFDNANAQANYFIGLTKYNLTNYTYQRVNRGVARVGIKADNLYDCNYLMFKNESFGNKWFYAYITAVEYVNNECSQISFEIDVMQTWLFDHTPDYCFVEREHSVTDNIGEHIEPENLATGEYVMNSYAEVLGLADLVTILCVNEIGGSGSLRDGIFTGSTVYVYDSEDVARLTEKLAEYEDAPDQVVSIYMCPKKALKDGVIPENHKLYTTFEGETDRVTMSTISPTFGIDGYTPKNNKLYTYPYNFINVSNSNGSELNLRYELFSGLTPIFEIEFTSAYPVQVILRPYNYKGVSGVYVGENVTLQDYPVCNWNSDAYKAWLAQNSIPMMNNMVTSIGTSLASGGLIQSISSGIENLSNILSQSYQASITAPISKGTMNVGSVNCSHGRQTFYYGRCSITAEYAKIIDDYFNTYGYAIHRVKIPNRNSRPHWNFVKTIKATITGSVPSDDMRKICSIYDSGITFWKNGDNVGNYSLDNRPT